VKLLIEQGVWTGRHDTSNPPPDDCELRDGHRSEAAALLAPWNINLPTLTLMERIFALEDLEFVQRENPWLKSTLARERSRIALLWLKDLRTSAKRVFLLHRLIARQSASLSVAAEVRVLSGYLAFRVLLEAARILIHVLGPWGARQTIRRAFVTMNHVSITVGRVTEQLDPTVRAGLMGAWAAHSGAAR
jgi:hypothetical protein